MNTNINIEVEPALAGERLVRMITSYSAQSSAWAASAARMAAMNIDDAAEQMEAKAQTWWDAAQQLAVAAGLAQFITDGPAVAFTFNS